MCVSHSGLVWIAGPYQWGRFCPAANVFASEERHKLFQAMPADTVFGEEIGRICLSQDLPQVDALRPHGLLYPQSMCVQMPELAQALSCAYADCSG